MLDETVLEHRLAAVERAIADLQRRLDSGPAPAHWLDKLAGSITDESAFREVLELGRAFRSVERPSDEVDTEP